MEKFNVSNIELKWKRVMIETKLKSNKKTLRFKHRIEMKNESGLKQIWNKIKKWKNFFFEKWKKCCFRHRIEMKTSNDWNKTETK